MKKLVVASVAFAVAILTFGISAISVSAEEYEVEKGDTLWDIANTYQTTVNELKSINKLDDTIIYPEQTLNTDQKEVHTVEEGDTLSEIAKEYDVSVKKIKEWNDLSSDLIRVGQELDVSSDEQASSNESKQTEKVSTTEENEESSVEEETETSDEKQSEDHKNQDDNQSESPEGETFSASATAYTAYCDGCSGKTATGVDLIENPDQKVIAVDPDVIPLGTEVYVDGYGYATAEDTGGDIKGDRIDVYIPSEDEALEWGSQSVEVTIIDE